ncbi:glycosyltransferase 87 family protein [soil metagenome]
MKRPGAGVELAPSLTDPIARSASRIIGGPLGTRAVVGAGGSAAVAATVTVLGAMMMALAVLQKGPCVVYGWADPDHFWRACYSDIAVVNASSVLAERGFPYAGESPSEQPALSGLTMWVLSLVSPYDGGDRLAQQWVFGLWAVAAMILVAGAIAALVSLRRDRPWQSAHLAISPVIAVLALISVDLMGVALVIWGIYAWSRDRPRLSGVLLGLSFLVRPVALVFALAVVLVSYRAGRGRSGITVLVSAAVSALAVYVPLLVVVGEPMLAAPRAWLSASPGYGALALLPSLLGAPLPAAVATGVAIIGWLAAAGAGWLLSARVSHVPPTIAVGALSAVMLLIVMLTATSVSLQTGLWVLPVLALSAVMWRDHLIWAAIEIVHFEAAWLYIGFSADRGRGLPPQAYAVAVAARALAWAYVVGRIWWEARSAAPQGQGSTSSLPDVPPAARSRWASATSASG